MNKTQHRYGHIKDRPGSRRNFYRAVDPNVVLPRRFSLVGTPHLRDPYDQLQHGSCIWNALLLIFDYAHHLMFGVFADLSRLFGYRGTMMAENQDPSSDCGCMPADALAYMMRTGSCTEALWPYTADASGLVNTPPAECFANALTNQALQDQSLPQDVLTIKSAIWNKNPVLFGIQCFKGAYGIESDFAAQQGRVGMPSSYDQLQGNLGGHGIAAIGYDDDLQIPVPPKGLFEKWFGTRRYTTGAFQIQNSWGPDWGQGGRFWLPYDFVSDPNLADSFWTIAKVE